jgi:hypothetical protein
MLKLMAKATSVEKTDMLLIKIDSDPMKPLRYIKLEEGIGKLNIQYCGA